MGESHGHHHHHHGADLAFDFGAAEKSTRRVIVLNALMMVAEIAAGFKLHSMALMADGWHMGTHVAAFAITAFAYFFARRHHSNQRFSFGTGKIGVLGGFTSAIILGFVAVLMAVESVDRLFHPLPIQFNESIAIAAVGLVVNIASAAILHGGNKTHGHGDLNLRAAYLHVVADAVTSLLAIGALTAGKFLGWVRLDSVMGIVGALVVAQWAGSLIRQAGVVLLDWTPETDLPDEIRKAVEEDGTTRLGDLRVWQTAPGIFSAIVVVKGPRPRTAAYYKDALKIHEELTHVVVEVDQSE